MFRKLCPTIRAITTRRNCLTSLVCNHASLIKSRPLQNGKTLPSISGSRRTFCSEEEPPRGKKPTEQTEKEEADESTSSFLDASQSNIILEGLGQNIMGSLRRPKGKDRKDETRDRRIPNSWQTGVKYMESDAYKQAYGNQLIWTIFRRNFGGQFFKTPYLTRVTCVGEDGFINTGSPCPICRDEYLVLDYRNVKLLKQFVDWTTGKVYPYRKTNLCQMKHEELLVQMYLARDYGTIAFDVPFRFFDYRDYYLPEDIAHLKLEKDVQYDNDEMIAKAEEVPEFGDHVPFAADNTYKLP